MRAMRGSAWTSFGFAAQYGLRLVSTLFLTRLLDPEAFGLMSLAALFMAAITLLSDIGTGPSVIRSHRGTDIDFLRTAWTVQGLRGGGIALIACLLSWPIAQFYDQPLLFPMICALSLTALMEGLTSIAVPLAQRNMALRKLTTLDLIVQILATGLTILGAWALQSVWALVIGGLIGSALRLVLTHRMLPAFSHSFRLEPAALSEIVTFGRWILLGTLLTFLGGRGIQAVQGMLVPIDILGMLAIAGVIAWALGDLVSKIIGNVAFPSLAELVRTRPEAVPAALRSIQLLIIGGCLPLFLGLSYFAQDLIGLMYDDRYAQAGVFLSIGALNGFMGVLSMPYQNAMLAAGDSRFHAVVMGSAALFKIVGVIVGFHLGGIIWMLAAIGLANALVHLISASFARHRGIANLPLDAVALITMAVAYSLLLPATL
jgi:O-antigen/teichoic acid export membrane protein